MIRYKVALASTCLDNRKYEEITAQLEEISEEFNFLLSEV